MPLRNGVLFRRFLSQKNCQWRSSSHKLSSRPHGTIKDTEAEAGWSYPADARSNILKLVVGRDFSIFIFYPDTALADSGGARAISVPESVELLGRPLTPSFMPCSAAHTASAKPYIVLYIYRFSIVLQFQKLKSTIMQKRA